MSAIWIPLVITILTTIWVTIGCTYDLRLFFKRLRAERVDIHDDGRVDMPHRDGAAPQPLPEELIAPV